MSYNCKNLIDSENELYDMIKFYLNEQNKQKDLIQNVQIINELFIILSYNVKKIKNETLKTFLKLKIEDLRFEVKQLHSGHLVRQELLNTLDELDKILI